MRAASWVFIVLAALLPSPAQSSRRNHGGGVEGGGGEGGVRAAVRAAAVKVAAARKAVVRRSRGDGGGGDGRGGGGGDLVPLEPPTTFRLLLYVLSSSSKQHSTWRQYQRQTFLSAFGMRRGGRMEVTPTYGLQLFYVLDRSEQSASTREEQARHDDLLVVRNATGCVSKIITGLRDAAVRERADGQISAAAWPTSRWAGWV